MSNENAAMNAWIRNRGRAPVAATPPAAPPSAGTCRNVRAARSVATDMGLLDDHGEPDWARVAQEAPEFFAATSLVPPGHAGAGTGAPPPDTRSLSQRVNDAIRRATGRW